MAKNSKKARTPPLRITGASHRIKYYDMIWDYIRKFEGVVYMTGSEILDWYRSAKS